MLHASHQFWHLVDLPRRVRESCGERVEATTERPNYMLGPPPVPPPPPPLLPPPPPLLVIRPQQTWDQSSHQHPLSAPLRQLALGLRCASQHRRDAVRFDFAVPLLDRTADSLKFSRVNQPVVSLADAPRGARCHFFDGDHRSGGWRCEQDDPAMLQRRRRRKEALQPLPALGPCEESVEAIDWPALGQLARAWGVFQRVPTKEPLRVQSERLTSSWPYYHLVIVIAGSTTGGGDASNPTTQLDRRGSAAASLRHQQRASTAPLSFYLSALQALRVPGHNVSEPFLIIAPSIRHPIAEALVRAMPQAAHVHVQPFPQPEFSPAASSASAAAAATEPIDTAETTARSADGGSSTALAAGMFALASASQIVSGDPDLKYYLTIYRKPHRLSALW